MQTFLPYVSFERCAKVLDYRRLGKQRVEAYQILNTITGRSDGWKKHPAVRMWQGYEVALLDYAFHIIIEWRRRGYNDNMMSVLNSEYTSLNSAKYVRPHWLGDQRLHSSHRAALLLKDHKHYSRIKPRWKEEPKLDYFWPAPAELAVRQETA